jgi:hypothetical protein
MDCMLTAGKYSGAKPEIPKGAGGRAMHSSTGETLRISVKIAGATILL